MADYKFITSTGVVVPDTASILADVEQEYRDAFGQDLQTTPDTPQGVLIAAEVAARIAVARNNAALANQINPELAGGVFLDAICALTGLQRDSATRTQVLGVVVTGQPSTLIPAGVRARTTAGDLFESVGAVVLDSLGQGSVSFQSVEFGPVPCAPGTLTQVVDSVLGWETVTNPNAGTPGTLQQSDASLRSLRRRALALQAISAVEAQVSSLRAVPEVRSLQFRENVTNATQIIDGITLVAHSVWACVDGGTDQDIARTLLENKTVGAAWNGAVSVPVVEPASGQTYTVLFDRPTPVPVLIRVTVRQGTATVDPVSFVRDTILRWVSGELDGEPGLGVGDSLSPFEVAGAINREGAGLYVQLVEVSYVTPLAYQTTELAIATDEIASVGPGSVAVIVAS